MDVWTAVSAASAVAGITLFAATVRSLVRTMLVPRTDPTRIAQLGRQVTFLVGWAIASRRKDFAKQDRVLASIGPVSFLMNLFSIMLLLGLAFALMMYGFSPLTFEDALYQAGSTTLTLGFVEPVNMLQVAIAFMAAFTGLVVVAIFIGYLLTHFSLYTSREVLVTKAGLLAGEPAWGPELISRRQLIRPDTPLSPEAEGWVDWVCELRSAQTVYPLLNFFRSPSPHRNWAVTMLAMMDAATLQVTVCEHPDDHGFTEFIAEGIQTFGVLRRNQDVGLRMAVRPTHLVPHDPLPLIGFARTPTGVADAIRADALRSAGASPGDALMHAAPSQLTREEFDRACRIMEDSGVRLLDDRDKAWEDFRSVRSLYEANAYAMTYRIHAVPAPWSGPRAMEVATIWPNLAVELGGGDG